MIMNEEAVSDPRSDNLNYFIWDSTRIEAVESTDEDADLAAIFGKVMTSYKRTIYGAFVATNDHARSQAEKYIAYSKKLESSWEFKVFDNVTSAREWINEHI